MKKVSGVIIKIVVGFIVIRFLINTLSPGGALGNLTGMLISKYPFHQQLLSIFSSSLGWDVSFVPVIKSSILDDILILLIAAVISGAITNVLKNIFNPVDMREEGAEKYVRSVGYRMKGVLVSVLSGIVSILISNMVFASILQKVNESFVGGFLFTVLKVLVLVLIVLLLIAFVKGIAQGVSGDGFGVGVFVFFLLRTLIQAVVVAVLSVYLLTAIVNHATAIAGPLFVIYTVLILGSFVTKSQNIY